MFFRRLLLPYKLTPLLFIITAGCKKTNEKAFTLFTDYYPLKLQSCNIYSVDSTHYNDFNHTETQFLFELKDSVVSVIEDDSSRYTVRIERYKREPGKNWNFQKVITRTITGRRAEEFIDNQRFVRLIFPPKPREVWNGNTYNNLGRQEYIIVNAHIPFTEGNTSADSVVTVKQIDENNLIREDTAWEVYAKNIGLIKKEVKALNKDIGSGKILSGHTYSMLLKSYK